MKKVRKIILYDKKRKVDTLYQNTLLDIVNRQLDVEIIHVDTNGQYSITASQNILNSIYMTDA